MKTGPLHRNQLLATKFFVPSSPNIVIARPRLFQLLQTGLAYRLLLLSAPAGFGKSTVSGRLPCFRQIILWSRPRLPLHNFWPIIIQRRTTQKQLYGMDDKPGNWLWLPINLLSPYPIWGQLSFICHL
ncbi:MAG TPA: hypothetical protein VGN34_24515 [Ktedonobacteraceae bacterium]